MSNRFHNKFHRHNHHSIPTDQAGLYPDSAFDPIASRQAPFQGEFYSEGQITTTESLSAGKNLYAIDGQFYRDVVIDRNLLVKTDAVINDNLTVFGDSFFKNNVIIDGDLTVLGSNTQLDTLVYVTSALSATNVGTGPALFVKQTGSEPIAVFYDDSNIALYVDGKTNTPGYVGINTSTPNEKLTVVGNISGNGNLFITQNSFLSGISNIQGALRVGNPLTLTVNQNGNNRVGIRTETPSSSLHINATDALILPIGNNSQRVDVQGGIRYNSQLSAYEGFDGLYWGTLGGVIDVDKNTFILAEDFPGANNDQLKFVTAGTQKMIIQPTGRVGIGTNNPQTILHVSSTDALVIPVGNNAQRVNVQGGIRYNQELLAFEGYDGVAWGTLGGVIDIDKNTFISAENFPGANNDQLKFVTAGIEKMIIQPDGKVGIGTSTPNQTLTIQGTLSTNNLLFTQDVAFRSLERPSLTGVKQALDDFLYVPVSFASPGFASINQTTSRDMGSGFTNAVLTWNSNKLEPTAITQYYIIRPDNTVITQTVNPHLFTSYTDPNTYNATSLSVGQSQSTSTWLLTAVDWKGNRAFTSVSVNWRFRAYYGVLNTTTPNSTDIINGSTSGLGSNFLITGRTGHGNIAVNPVNQRWFVAYPSRFGTVSSINVGNLPNTDYSLFTLNGFNNGLGATDNYYVYYSNNATLNASYLIQIF
jgi:hypothetical protein